MTSTQLLAVGVLVLAPRRASAICARAVLRATCPSAASWTSSRPARRPSPPLPLSAKTTISDQRSRRRARPPSAPTRNPKRLRNCATAAGLRLHLRGCGAASAAARAAARSGRRRAACPSASGGRPGRAEGSDHGPCVLVQDVDLGLAQAASSSRSVTSSPYISACGDQAVGDVLGGVLVDADRVSRRSRSTGRAGRRPACAWRGRRAPLSYGSRLPERCMSWLPIFSKRSMSLLLPSRAPRGRRSGRRGRSAPGAMPAQPTICAALHGHRCQVAADAGRVLAVEDVLRGHRAERPDQVADLLGAPVHEAVLDPPSPGGGRRWSRACRIDSRVDMPFSM